jgi:hypothetical protein
MLSYMRENLNGLREETLTDFLAKNGEQHRGEPDLKPERRLICVVDEGFEHIFRNRERWERFRREVSGSDGIRMVLAM